MQLFKALICQILACIVVLLLSGWLARWNIWAIVPIQATAALILSAALRQPVWWRFIHLFFMPAVSIMLAFHLPSWLYLSSLLVLVLVFWGTVKGDVPLFLSSSAVGDAVIAIARRENAASFADIGAGIGTVVVAVSRQLADLRIDALERAPLPWLIARWRCRNLANVSARYVSLWGSRLAGYDIVFAFLSPLVMAEVGNKIRRDMPEGSLFVSSSFPVPDWVPESIVEVNDRRQTRLYCYRIRKKTINKVSARPKAYG